MHQQTELKMSCLYIPENGRIFYNKEQRGKVKEA